MFEFLRTKLPSCKIILHKARFTNFYYNKEDELQRIGSSLDVERLNEDWEMLDRYVLENFDLQYIDLGYKNYAAYEDHPWGLFGVHYELKYYNEFLNNLHQIVLTNYLSNHAPVYKNILEALKK